MVLKLEWSNADRKMVIGLRCVVSRNIGLV